MAFNKNSAARSKDWKQFLATAREKYPNLKFKSVKQLEAFKWVYSSGWNDSHNNQIGELEKEKLEKQIDILKEGRKLSGKQVSKNV